MRQSIILAAGLAGLAACASGGEGPALRWSASAWDGLAAQTIGTQNHNFFAAPVGGEGFRLKLTLMRDGDFRIQEADADTLQAELEEAARLATPEGCRFVSLTRTQDGGAEADYDCES
ncbi:MAG: hypothetical protein ACK4MQ_03125 [Hyphomonas sp.]